MTEIDTDDNVHSVHTNYRTLFNQESYGLLMFMERVNWRFSCEVIGIEFMKPERTVIF